MNQIVTKIQNVPLYGLSTYLQTRGEVTNNGE
jgi:hypothetical protein